MMSVPLLHDERALGVLNVLDRSKEIEFSLGQMELLGLFANQAAIALDLLGSARRAKAALADAGDAAVVARVASRLDALEDERRAAGLALLRALADVLTPE
jgi:GAF domain-containing protein